VNTPINESDRYRALLLNSNPSFFGIQPLFSKDGGSTWAPEGIPNEIGLTLLGTPVPEPAVPMLFAVGATLFAARIGWRRRRRAAA
jgi:hypothetical protein